MMTFTEQQRQAFGLSGQMLTEYQQGDRQFPVHHDMLGAFLQLQADAAKAGFSLALVSSHRTFQQQLAIWCAKAAGKRRLYDRQGQALDYQRLDKQQLLQAILRWSALPGLSRHHWGCDIDVFDASAMQIDDVRLVPAEVEEGGPCVAMHKWLTEKIDSNCSHGFFRPYQNNACQVAEEKWHLSYQPVAGIYEQSLAVDGMSADNLAQLWQEHDLPLLDAIKPQIQSIIRDYAILNRERLPGWLNTG